MMPTQVKPVSDIRDVLSGISNTLIGVSKNFFIAVKRGFNYACLEYLLNRGPVPGKFGPSDSFSLGEVKKFFREHLLSGSNVFNTENSC